MAKNYLAQKGSQAPEYKIIPEIGYEFEVGEFLTTNPHQPNAGFLQSNDVYSDASAVSINPIGTAGNGETVYRIRMYTESGITRYNEQPQSPTFVTIPRRKASKLEQMAA